jgi:hypothetical protein
MKPAGSAIAASTSFRWHKPNSGPCPLLGVVPARTSPLLLQAGDLSLDGRYNHVEVTHVPSAKSAGDLMRGVFEILLQRPDGLRLRMSSRS